MGTGAELFGAPGWHDILHRPAEGIHGGEGSQEDLQMDSGAHLSGSSTACQVRYPTATSAATA